LVAGKDNMADGDDTSAPEEIGSSSDLARWIRRELIIAGVLVPAGCLLLPLAIYFTGQALLGQYSDSGEGIGRLYGDIFRDVASGSPSAILLILSPWLGLQALRLALLPLRRRRTGSGAQPQ
jgi:hypothetical protein